MPKLRRKKIKSNLSGTTLHRILPNMATAAALCAGMSAIRFAFMGRWETAVSFIIVAAVLDGMDGRLARLLGSVSRFGAQLDSLADFVCFGVAPGLILYLFALKGLGGFGWSVSLVFIVCMAMRLARFNAQAETPGPAWRSQFFTGTPAPAAGILGLSPLIAWFGFEWEWAHHPWIIAGIALTSSALMVSRLPTYAFKTLKVSSQLMRPLLILAAIFVASMISAPWQTLFIMILGYLALIPHSLWKYRQILKQNIEVPHS